MKHKLLRKKQNIRYTGSFKVCNKIYYSGASFGYANWEFKKLKLPGASSIKLQRATRSIAIARFVCSSMENMPFLMKGKIDKSILKWLTLLKRKGINI